MPFGCVCVCVPGCVCVLTLSQPLYSRSDLGEMNEAQLEHCAVRVQNSPVCCDEGFLCLRCAQRQISVRHISSV